MPDDISQILHDGDVQAADDAVRQGLSLGVKPDEEGRLLDLSRRSGMPVETIRGAPATDVSDLIERDTRVRVLDKNERVARWMAENPNYASISHDDTDALDRITASADAWHQSFTAGATVGEKVKATLLSVPRGILGNGIGGLSNAVYGLAQAGAEGVGADGAAGYFQERAEIGRNLNTYIQSAATGVPFEQAQKAQEKLSRDNVAQVSILGRRVGLEEVSGALVSLAPGIAAGALTGGGAWAFAAAGALQSTGGTYADLRAEGVSGGEAGAKSVLAGVITGALTRYLGPNADKALGRILTAAKDPRATTRAILSQSVGKTAAGEATEEGLDQFLQSFLIKGMGLQESLADGVQAGLIGGIVGGGVGIGEARQAAIVAKATQASDFAQATQGLISQIDAAKTNERSKTVMQSFLQSASPEMAKADVFVDGESLMPIIQDIRAAQALEAAGITKTQIQQAAAAGSTVEISMAKLVTDLPAAVRDQILPFVRQSPGAMNVDEADKVKTEGDGPSEEASPKKAARVIKAEESRILKEFKAAAKIDDETARTSLLPLFRGARSLFMNNPGADPTSLLKKVSFKAGDVGAAQETLAKIRQQIVDGAGPQGKTALSRISFAALPNGAAARVDVLTGLTTVNPQAAQAVGAIDGVLAQIRAVPGLDLQGKKVKTEQGSEVDAEQAVATLRERASKAQRLMDCLTRS